MPLSTTSSLDDLEMYYGYASPIHWMMVQQEYRELADCLYIPNVDDHEYNCLNSMANYLEETLESTRRAKIVKMFIEGQARERMLGIIELGSLEVEISWVRDPRY